MSQTARPMMRRQGPHHPFGPRVKLAEDVIVHDTALIHGLVSLGTRVSVWPHVVIRSEKHGVTIGEGTNLQDFVMVHIGGATPTVIGRNCSITHHCTIHGAEIGDDCLIGINATVMDGAKIGAGSIVAGHAIVNQGSEFPPHSIIAGTPAKVIKTRDASEPNRANADWYWRNAQAYSHGVHHMDDW